MDPSKIHDSGVVQGDLIWSPSEEGKGTAHLPGVDGTIKQLAMEKIRPSHAETQENLVIKVQDSVMGGEPVEVAVRVQDAAKLLGKEEPEVLEAAKSGKLEKMINEINRLPDLADDQLQKAGLTREEYKQIREHFSDHLQFYATQTTPVHIRRSNFIPPLPRSVLFVPGQGLYILAKSKGGAKEVGVGSFNRATLAVNFATGEKKIFRTGKREHVSSNELEATKEMAEPKYFASGVVVDYLGPWRERAGRKQVLDKDQLPIEEDVEKVGFLMDFLEGGELFDAMYSMSPEEKLEVAKKMAGAIDVMHQRGWVHLDLKPENTFLTRERSPRIADFGMAMKAGRARSSGCGTPGFIAPELYEATISSPYLATPKSDVWSMGCILAELFHGSGFYEDQQGDNFFLGLNESKLEVCKNILFPDRRTPDTIDSLIDACLQTNPDNRIDMNQLEMGLMNISDKLSGQGGR